MATASEFYNYQIGDTISYVDYSGEEGVQSGVITDIDYEYSNIQINNDWYDMFVIQIHEKS